MIASKLDTLDIDRFRKVHALIKGGATAGERDAATARATEMAKNAGMSLKEAASKLDAAQPKPKVVNIFEGFDDYKEEREPGYKVREAVKRSERNSMNQVRRDEILREYGSLKAFFDPTPMERVLLAAGRPFAKRRRVREVCGTMREYTYALGGSSSDIDLMRDIGPEAVAAITAAVPMPATLQDAVKEIKAWDRLRWDRGLFSDSGEWYPHREVEVRYHLVEKELKERRVTSWDDMEARFAWRRYEFSRQWIDPTERDDPVLDRMELDFAILRKMDQEARKPPVQTGRMTNAVKRDAVLSILDAEPNLSDREIARRASVSPQTVGNWRRR